jgi:hypothetical protein
VSYPQIIDFNEAVQDPRNSFRDAELKAGSVATTPLGLPLALSGGFALTYTVQSGHKKFAVRCFHREVPQAQARYAQISSKLRALASPYFVNFDFQSDGIRIRGKPYPVVKMDWIEGDTLGIYLDRSSTTPSILGNLRKAFSELNSYLERNGVAHGDIQNENVIVQGGAVRLIDYDGMFVPGMAEGQGTEVGHKHFQHPGRGPKHFGPGMDRFSFIVLDVSFEAMQADVSLHRRFREGGQAIIFKANDFADPSSSEVFRVLKDIPSVRESANKLAAICGAPITDVPTLSDFLAGRNIPIAVAPPVGAPQRPVSTPTYIGAFPVVDGKDFQAAMRHVGDKIEIVGQIVSVKEGTGRRGRGRGRPYMFINLGIWNQDSVKITIWSEGLGNMSTRPTEAWVGRWISVTGLVEPPYEGKLYGRSYRNVGITVSSDNQIIQISPQEAKFRLGRGTLRAASDAAVDRNSTSNAAILDSIRGGSTRTGQRNPQRTQQSVSPPPKPQPARTRNEQILRNIQATSVSGQTASGSPSYSSPKPFRPPPRQKESLLSRIPVWVWIGAAILAYIFFA